jgi:hypothetical protein
MKKFVLLVTVLCFAVRGFADINVNNFIGYHDGWGPFGNPNTATFGEVFTVPTNGDASLSIFSFYMGSAAKSGDIVTGAYIATWTGTHAGYLVYSSQRFDYDNYGDEEFVNNTYGLNLQAGADYVMFLSVSQYYGQSSGQSFMSAGGSNPYLKGFVADNNGWRLQPAVHPKLERLHHVAQLGCQSRLYLRVSRA